jgi:hypothetical protein
MDRIAYVNHYIIHGYWNQGSWTNGYDQLRLGMRFNGWQADSIPGGAGQ